jgi:hypothetical protein
MALPEQIRKQTEAVQALYDQLNGDGNNTGEEQKPADGTAEPIDNTADESTAQNIAPPPANEQKASETNPEDENSETYAQRWRSLQGSYNAEVRTRHELQNRVQQMEQLLSSLSSQQVAPTQHEPQVAKLVTEKDVEEYGDSIDMMRKVTREELGTVAQRIAQIENAMRQMHSSVVPQVQAVAQRQQMSSEQQFWSDLTRAEPSWRAINDDQRFQNWLLEADPLTGITRQTYLEDAQRNLDAGRVANFFRSWLEITGQATNAQQPSRSAASELERQVAPGRSKTASTPTSNTAKMYSPKDIEKFFADVRQGKYKGREAERDKIERDIFSAQRENRIVANA